MATMGIPMVRTLRMVTILLVGPGIIKIQVMELIQVTQGLALVEVIKAVQVKAEKEGELTQVVKNQDLPRVIIGPQ